MRERRSRYPSCRKSIGVSKKWFDGWIGIRRGLPLSYGRRRKALKSNFFLKKCLSDKKKSVSLPPEFGKV